MAEKKDKHFIKKPFYPGGQEAFKKFIQDNLKYPEEAIKNKIEGTVVAKYKIDYKGKVSDIKILKGIGYGCDEEAIRVIKLLKFEVPKEPRKLRVTFNRENKIFFKLPKTVKPTTSKVQYQYKATKKEPNTNKAEEKKSSYNYTINW